MRVFFLSIHSLVKFGFNCIILPWRALCLCGPPLFVSLATLGALWLHMVHSGYTWYTVLTDPVVSHNPTGLLTFLKHQAYASPHNRAI
jgi:hypothetical protein